MRRAAAAFSAHCVALPLSALALLPPADSAEPAAATKPLIGAFYFGDWHVDPQMAALHGPNWTEFEVAISATPRFPGHLQPNVPLESPARGMGQNVSEVSHALWRTRNPPVLRVLCPSSLADCLLCNCRSRRR